MKKLKTIAAFAILAATGLVVLLPAKVKANSLKTTDSFYGKDDEEETLDNFIQMQIIAKIQAKKFMT